VYREVNGKWKMSGEMKSIVKIMAYFPKARTEEPEKPPLLGNGCVTSNSTKAINN
jgi:hypothetical protein